MLSFQQKENYFVRVIKLSKMLKCPYNSLQQYLCNINYDAFPTWQPR